MLGISNINFEKPQLTQHWSLFSLKQDLSSSTHQCQSLCGTQKQLWKIFSGMLHSCCDCGVIIECRLLDIIAQQITIAFDTKEDTILIPSLVFNCQNRQHCIIGSFQGLYPSGTCIASNPDACVAMLMASIMVCCDENILCPVKDFTVLKERRYREFGQIQNVMTVVYRSIWCGYDCVVESQLWTSLGNSFHLYTQPDQERIK